MIKKTAIKVGRGVESFVAGVEIASSLSEETIASLYPVEHVLRWLLSPVYTATFSPTATYLFCTYKDRIPCNLTRFSNSRPENSCPPTRPIFTKTTLIINTF